MKLLILGKNGQVGSALVGLCESQGVECDALGRDEVDVSSPEELGSFFERHGGYDFVINATAYTAVDKAELEPEVANNVNHLAVRNIALQCKKHDIPLIHISTDYVFDGSKKTSYAEGDPVSPLGVYGVSKLKGEKALQEVWSKHIILRVSWVFGTHGNNFVKTMAKLSTIKEELGVVSDQCGSPTSAQDIARVIIEVCRGVRQSEAGKWGVYHYSGFPVTTWHQLAVAAISEAKAQGMAVVVQNIKAIETKDYPTPTKRPVNSAFDISKISRIFNVEQSAWRDDLPVVIENLKREMG
ncbi:dTDP-4-dehydrorhamnose reductase [Francisellaceae bacterium]|nr:dTDP-4-dehydrorhamnose reductase [Francisellaceae bacterium]